MWEYGFTEQFRCTSTRWLKADAVIEMAMIAAKQKVLIGTKRRFMAMQQSAAFGGGGAAGMARFCGVLPAVRSHQAVLVQVTLPMGLTG
jgi:hypothetical protein